MAVILLLWLTTAVSEFLLGRYLAQYHPDTWRDLGCPGKIGRFGRERDGLGVWLRNQSFKKIADPRLHTKCLFVRALSRITIVLSLFGVLGIIGLSVLRK